MSTFRNFYKIQAMFKNSATNLLNQSPETASKWLRTIDTVLTDCDGVLWRENKPTLDAPATINALKAAGKRVFFVTNNGTRSRRAIWERAHGMGFDITETDIISPAYSIAQHLRVNQFEQEVYVIGSEGITQELDAVGISHFGLGRDNIERPMNEYIKEEVLPLLERDVGAVIVGWDEHFSYGKMLKASNFLAKKDKCLFLTTNVDAAHRFPAYQIPGTGAMVKAIETCTGRKAVEFGKPNPVVGEALIKEGLLDPERTLMIGDCTRIDVPFGKNCGFHTLLVGTGSGEYTEVMEMLKEPIKNELNIPDVYLPCLGDLKRFI